MSSNRLTFDQLEISAPISPLNASHDVNERDNSIEESHHASQHQRTVSSSVNLCYIEKLCKRISSAQNYNLRMWGSNIPTEGEERSKEIYMNNFFDDHSVQPDLNIYVDDKVKFSGSSISCSDLEAESVLSSSELEDRPMCIRPKREYGIYSTDKKFNVDKNRRPSVSGSNCPSHNYLQRFYCEENKSKKMEQNVSFDCTLGKEQNKTNGCRSCECNKDQNVGCEKVKREMANHCESEDKERNCNDSFGDEQYISQLLSKFDERFPDDNDDKTLYEHVVRQGIRTKTRILFDTMMAYADSNGFEMKDTSPNGDCMFQSVIDQMRINGDYRFSVLSLRRQITEYLRENPTHSDGTPLECFLVGGENWSLYLNRISKPKEWGDHIILQTASELLRRKIIVFNVSSTKSVTQHEILPVEPVGDKKAFYLGHLGEMHYLSLRPKEWKERMTFKTNRTNDTGKSSHGQGSHGPSLFNSKSCEIVWRIPLRSFSFLLLKLIHLMDICTLKLSSVIKGTHDVSIETAGGRSDGTEVFVKHRDTAKYNSECNRRFRSELPLTIICKKRPLVVCGDEECDLKQVARAELDMTRAGYCRLLSLSEKGIDYLRATKSVPGIAKGSLQDKRSLSGLFCPKWPHCAKEWLTRQTVTGFPNPIVKKKVIEAGCLVVQKPHPLSTQPDIEWQFLFSFAEKNLMEESMSLMQLYAYYILKVSVDYQTNHLKEKLHTAHIKSLLLFACEELHENQFEEFPGDCYLYLLQKILDCLRNRHFPNYFVSENNMIDHFKDTDVENLINAIAVLREFPLQCLTFIMGEHGHNRSWIVDIFEKYYETESKMGLNRDKPRFLFPLSIRMAQKFAIDGLYYRAYLNIVQSRLMLIMTPPSKGDKTMKIPSLEYIIGEALKPLDEYTKCAVAQTVEERTGIRIFSEMELIQAPPLPKEESVDEFVDGLSLDVIGNVYMKANELNNHGVYYHNQIPGKCEEAAYYYLEAINLLEKATNKDINDPESGTCVNKLSIFERIVHYDTLSLLCYKNLVNAYDQLGHIEKIESRMPHLERVCKRLYTPNSEAFVKSVWTQLGQPERGLNLH